MDPFVYITSVQSKKKAQFKKNHKTHSYSYLPTISCLFFIFPEKIIVYNIKYKWFSFISLTEFKKISLLDPISNIIINIKDKYNFYNKQITKLMYWISNQSKQQIFSPNNIIHLKDYKLNINNKKNVEIVTQKKKLNEKYDKYNNENEMVKGNMKSFNTFTIIKLIGAGAFGSVYLCKINALNTYCALKVLRKTHLLKCNQLKRTLIERNIMANLNPHPFIIKMYKAFETPQYLNFALEYCPGGDLFFLLDRYNRFSEDMARFYAGSIFLALNHLHLNNIIFRDLKPENILIDSEGFIRLTDFGLASFSHKRPISFCGSYNYMAPEVITGVKPYDKMVDLWSLGCILYEMLTGLPPFYNELNENHNMDISNQVNHYKIFEKIKYGNVYYPTYLSYDAISIISMLLNKNSNKRLGFGDKGYRDILEHPFFKGKINWYLLTEKKVLPPYCPKILHPLDVSHFGDEYTEQKIKIENMMDDNYLINISNQNENNDFPNFDWNYNENN